jgi:hypothetical protein
MESQLFGGSDPSGPRPGRNRKRSRSGLPGADSRASWNHGCSLEVWLGTMSASSFSPRAWDSWMRVSTSSRVPYAGSTSRKSLTS